MFDPSLGEMGCWCGSPQSYIHWESHIHVTSGELGLDGVLPGMGRKAMGVGVGWDGSHLPVYTQSLAAGLIVSFVGILGR